MDRVNVGGSESGQQSGYQAKGASGADATWNLDGVPITDMAATGATPQVLGLRHVPGNERHDGRRGSDGRDRRRPARARAQVRQPTRPMVPRASTSKTSRCRRTTWIRHWPLRWEARTARATGRTRYEDYGFEVGGPIMKDHLWGWGSIGKTDVRILTIKQTPDRTILEQLRRKGLRAGVAVHPRQLHVLQGREIEIRPRRQRDASAGDDLRPVNAGQRLLQG